MQSPEHSGSISMNRFFKIACWLRLAVSSADSRSCLQRSGCMEWWPMESPAGRVKSAFALRWARAAA